MKTRILLFSKNENTTSPFRRFYSFLKTETISKEKRKHLNRKLIFLSVFSILACVSIQAQDCNYLAYDYFGNAPNSPLEGSYSGQGWTTPWDVQNNNASVPGYQLNNTTPLSFGALQTAGNYASGGQVFLTAGRDLDNTVGGTFDSYLAGDNIGAAGTTFFTSLLLRKDANNADWVFMSLSNSTLGWCIPCSTAEVAVGYFGTDSDIGGQRRWSLRINGTVYPSSEAVVVGTAALLVLQFDFDATTNINLFVNPASLAGAAPAPTLSQSTTDVINFRTIALYLGDFPNSASVDEIRFADSYACATIDNTLTVNVPPFADFTMSPSSGNAPLAVTLDGSLSNDSDGTIVSYEWDFGDGTPTATGSPVLHTFEALGIITVSLTITDNNGAQNTAFHTITIRDVNGEFPCQSRLELNVLADCTTQSGGGLSVFPELGSTVTLMDGAVTISPTSGTEYTGLDAGVYQLDVTGVNGCHDTWEVHIPIDSVSCPGWSRDICDMKIGTNLNGFADWGVERPMRNIMKQARTYRPTYTDACFCWDLGVNTEIIVDANGYPLELPQTTSAGATKVRQLISSDEGSLQVGKRYVLLYDGVGTILVAGAVTIVNQVPGRIEFDVTIADNIFVDMQSSQLGNHIRNMRLLRIEDEFVDLNAKPFYEGFLHKIAPFDVLRFMDWGRTNNSPISSWADRKELSYYTYAGDEGVPYELMIELANTVQKDVWICIPHEADDNFIAELARMFRDDLNPDLTIYIEYSNEVWNWLFDQAYYNYENRANNLNNGRAYAERSKNLFDIWYAEFGAAAPTRLERVLGLQGLNNYLNTTIMSQLDQSDWDYASPTWYFGLDYGVTGNPVLTAGSTGQDVVDNARFNWQNNDRAVIYQDYLNTFVLGKGIINYEGGQHFSNFTNPPYLQAMIDSHVEPDIYNLYDEVLDDVRDWGSELPMMFTLADRQDNTDRGIIFGHLDHIDVEPPYRTTAPKYQAILDNMCQVAVQPSVALQGAYNSGTGMMGVTLNTNNLIPISEPYTDAPSMSHTYKGGFEVMTTAAQALTGGDAIVDWVMVELRDKNNSSTVLASRAVLLQADGDVVDTDGISPVNFFGLAPDDYFVAVRHRNHLGVMTATAVTLN